MLLTELACSQAIGNLSPGDVEEAFELLAQSKRCSQAFSEAGGAARTTLLALRESLFTAKGAEGGMLRRVGRLYCALDDRRSARLAALLGRLVSAAEGDSGRGGQRTPFEQGARAAVGAISGARRQVFRSLFRPVRAELGAVSALPAWSATPGGKEAGVGAAGREALPSFSVGPSEYVHTIASLLLDIPTQVHEGSLFITDYRAIFFGAPRHLHLPHHPQRHHAPTARRRPPLRAHGAPQTATTRRRA